jgi:fibronectin type 3 domain-containing protein
MRQTLRVCLVILVLFMVGTSFASAAGATVTASPTSVNFGSVTINTSSPSATIVLKNTGPYSKLNSALLTSTSYTDSNIVSGQTYYFVTTAVDSSGMESTYSNQVSAVIP